MRTLYQWIGYWGSVGSVVLAGLLLTGCKTGGADSKYAAAGAPGAATDPGATAAAPTPSGPSDLDRISPGDMLIIVFSEMPKDVLPFEDRVKEDGTITLLENKVFHAAGKTRGELEKEIRATYVPDFYLTMTVSVRQQKDTQFYFVGGEVKQPNRQIYISRITVTKAIQSAGDFTDFARKKAVELTRADGRKFIVNAIKAQRDPSLDLEVLPGDKIYVPRRNPFW